MWRGASPPSGGGLITSRWAGGLCVVGVWWGGSVRVPPPEAVAAVADIVRYLVAIWLEAQRLLFETQVEPPHFLSVWFTRGPWVTPTPRVAGSLLPLIPVQLRDLVSQLHQSGHNTVCGVV